MSASGGVGAGGGQPSGAAAGASGAASTAPPQQSTQNLNQIVSWIFVCSSMFNGIFFRTAPVSCVSVLRGHLPPGLFLLCPRIPMAVDEEHGARNSTPRRLGTLARCWESTTQYIALWIEHGLYELVLPSFFTVLAPGGRRRISELCCSCGWDNLRTCSSPQLSLYKAHG